MKTSYGKPGDLLDPAPEREPEDEDEEDRGDDRGEHRLRPQLRDAAGTRAAASQKQARAEVRRHRLVVWARLAPRAPPSGRRPRAMPTPYCSFSALGRAAGDDPPAGDQRDVLAQRLGLLEVVRREQDRRALRRAAGGCSARARGAARCRLRRSARRGSRGAARAAARARAAGGGACPPESFGARTSAFARRSKTSIISSARSSDSRRSCRSSRRGRRAPRAR